MHTVEQEQCEPPRTRPAEYPSLRFGPLLILLASLAGAWIAAGSTGLLGHPLQKALALTALGIALAGPGTETFNFRLRLLLTPIVAALAIYLVAVSAPVVNVLAGALILAFFAWITNQREREVFLAGAVAVTVFGLCVFARTAVPWLWLAADRFGQSMAKLAGLFGPSLNAGATFAGLDFLLLSSTFWALCLVRTESPRKIRASYGFSAVIVGHLIYLIALAYVPSLLAAIGQPENVSEWSLTGGLHKILPWNAPALAGLIHLSIVAAMLRWSRWSPSPEPPPTPRSAAVLRTQLALSAGALSMAILVPVVAALYTQPQNATGQKIVFYEKGFLNWLKPEHGSYGRLSSGMYGILPVFVESLGADTLISPDLAEEDLQDADALVLLNPNEPWADGQLERIHNFVRQGGSLLLMGEHTEIDPNGGNRFNDVLDPTAMRVAFDSATFAVGGWLHSYETIDHPITVGVPDDRNQFGVVIGASVQAHWPARPLLIGRWGWADPGDETSDRAMMGNGRYDSGERLGDVVLAAEQPLGKGWVIAFGDTSSLQNAIQVTSHVFTARLFAYLAGTSPRAHPWWRQLLALLACGGLIGFLCWRPGITRTALVALGLAGSAVVCLNATSQAAHLVPDGRMTSPNNLAYIDASHLESYSGESWRPDGTGGLALTLMRNGYLTLALPELTTERLERAGLLISVAPRRSFSDTEIDAVRQFVTNGGLFIMTAGYDEARAGMRLLEEFGFGFGRDDSLEPAPLGHFKSPYLESENHRVYVRFDAAWPVRCTDPDAQVIAYGRDNLPVAILRHFGAGKAMLVGDTGFAMNKNLEFENGQTFEGLRENADFWRWLISVLRDDPMWLPPALQSEPAQDASDEEGQP